MAAATNRRRGAWWRVQRDSHMARQRVSGTGHGKGGEKTAGRGKGKGKRDPQRCSLLSQLFAGTRLLFLFSLKPFERLFPPKLERAGSGKAEGGGILKFVILGEGSYSIFRVGPQHK